MDAERVHDGGVAVEADHDQDERRRVHIERLDEHDDLAAGVSRQPLHRVEPHDVGRDVHERDQEIGDGEVHDQDIDARLVTSSPEDDDEDDDV